MVDIETAHNTDFSYSSEPTDINNDRVNKECCGVISARSESRHSDNDDYSITLY